jgi:hypothetical protein
VIERHETTPVALENGRRFGTAANLIRLLVLALGIRVVYLFAGYLLGFGAIKRFHVESATVAFVLVGLIWRIVRSR